MNDFPGNADGDALRRLAESGADMTRPMVINFAVAIPDEPTGKAIALKASETGYNSSVDQDLESSEWICYCSRLMFATYTGVINCQLELDKIAVAYGGFVDGWGTFGNLDEGN
ncbi:MAG: ribonuclease E inhibitor RraB [Desulfobacterales bacterium]|nr:ribonuclease E inhibitor RraB [Desulfobacterales bacterium]